MADPNVSYSNINEGIKHHLEFINLQVRRATLRDLAGPANIPGYFNLVLNNCYVNNIVFEGERSSVFCGKDCSVLGEITGNDRCLLHLRNVYNLNTKIIGFTNSLIRIADIETACTLKLEDLEGCRVEIVNCRDVTLNISNCSECEIIVYAVTDLKTESILAQSVNSSTLEIANIFNLYPVNPGGILVSNCYDSDIYLQANQANGWEQLIESCDTCSLIISFNRSQCQRGVNALKSNVELRNSGSLTWNDAFLCEHSSIVLKNIETFLASTMFAGKDNHINLLDIRTITSSILFKEDGSKILTDAIPELNISSSLGYLNNCQALIRAEKINVGQVGASLIDSKMMLESSSFTSGVVNIVAKNSQFLVKKSALVASCNFKLENSKVLAVDCDLKASQQSFMGRDAAITLVTSQIKASSGLDVQGNNLVTITESTIDAELSLQVDSGKVALNRATLLGDSILTNLAELEAVDSQGKSLRLTNCDQVTLANLKAEALSLASGNIFRSQGSSISDTFSVGTVNRCSLIEDTCETLALASIDSLMIDTLTAKKCAISDSSVDTKNLTISSSLSLERCTGVLNVCRAQTLEVQDCSTLNLSNIETISLNIIKSRSVRGDVIEAVSSITADNSRIYLEGVTADSLIISNSSKAEISDCHCSRISLQSVGASVLTSVTSSQLSCSQGKCQISSSNISLASFNSSSFELYSSSFVTLNCNSSSGLMANISAGSVSLNNGGITGHNSSLGTISLSQSGALLLGGSASVSVSNDSACLTVSSSGNVSNPHKPIVSSNGVLCLVSGMDAKTVGLNVYAYAKGNHFTIAEGNIADQGSTILHNMFPIDFT